MSMKTTKVRASSISPVQSYHPQRSQRTTRFHEAKRRSKGSQVALAPAMMTFHSSGVIQKASDRATSIQRAANEGVATSSSSLEAATLNASVGNGAFQNRTPPANIKVRRYCRYS